MVGGEGFGFASLGVIGRGIIGAMGMLEGYEEFQPCDARILGIPRLDDQPIKELGNFKGVRDMGGMLKVSKGGFLKLDGDRVVGRERPR